MYESACKLMAKQKVALECLSYHATASNDDALRLTSETIPSADKYNLYSFTFIDFDLNDDDTCRATVRMFKQCDLIQRFHIPYDVLCRWILSVRKNYRSVFYSQISIIRTNVTTTWFIRIFGCPFTFYSHGNEIYMRHIQLLATKIYFGVI